MATEHAALLMQLSGEFSSKRSRGHQDGEEYVDEGALEEPFEMEEDDGEELEGDGCHQGDDESSGSDCVHEALHDFIVYKLGPDRSKLTASQEAAIARANTRQSQKKLKTKHLVQLYMDNEKSL